MPVLLVSCDVLALTRDEFEPVPPDIRPYLRDVYDRLARVSDLLDSFRDETAALMATQRLVRLAREAGKRIHVLHISTKQEIEFLRDHKDVASCEATPHHLTLAAPGADADGTRRQVDSCQAGRAQAVDGQPGHFHREACHQGRHARHVAVILAGLVGAAQVNFFDQDRVQAGALDQRLGRRQL